jgi:hypothetical protein
MAMNAACTAFGFALPLFVMRPFGGRRPAYPRPADRARNTLVGLAIGFFVADVADGLLDEGNVSLGTWLAGALFLVGAGRLAAGGPSVVPTLIALLAANDVGLPGVLGVFLALPFVLRLYPLRSPFFAPGLAALAALRLGWLPWQTTSQSVPRLPFAGAPEDPGLWAAALPWVAFAIGVATRRFHAGLAGLGGLIVITAMMWLPCFLAGMAAR